MNLRDVQPPATAGGSDSSNLVDAPGTAPGSPAFQTDANLPQLNVLFIFDFRFAKPALAGGARESEKQKVESSTGLESSLMNFESQNR